MDVLLIFLGSQLKIRFGMLTIQIWGAAFSRPCHDLFVTF
jgi:hypothetical protein